jgi:hypothetical protein
VGDFNFHAASYATDNSDDYSEEDSISPTEQLTTAKSTASLAQKRWHELFN